MDTKTQHKYLAANIRVLHTRTHSHAYKKKNNNIETKRRKIYVYVVADVYLSWNLWQQSLIKT